ncbi:DUF983 domain-containing protein [Aquimarina brevivitae]|uniref:Uncharacterized protein DUF983 n=1 Tax=Aquimarina brevivitae TaxID=323412 RepID=A0A4Q7PGZ9_9FLAO|nr:DUF983 domain-containing protein [Aquimarina brevivitae]RZS99821.1 uncharacterized protein DUF983 [Aquimarina brevivitae]
MKLLKGTKLYSIITGYCPVCHKESMYTAKNPYLLGKIFDMHSRCSHCGTKYKIEPSFFYGAMYVSYGVGIAFAVAAFVIANLIFGLGPLSTFYAITGTLILLMPIIMRLSRNIWINFFLHYNKEKASTP